MIDKIRKTASHVDCSLSVLLNDRELPRQMAEAKKATHPDLSTDELDAYENMLYDGQKYGIVSMMLVAGYAGYKVTKLIFKALHSYQNR